MPSQQKMIDSTYQDLKAQASLRSEEAGARTRIISGAVEGLNADIHNSVPVLYLDVSLEAGARTTLPIPASHNGFIYLMEGNGQFGEPRTSAKAGQVLLLDYPTLPSGESILEVAADAPMRFLLITGQPIQEPVVAYGPYVMNSREQIVQAYEDYQQGKFGGPTPAMLEMTAPR